MGGDEGEAGASFAERLLAVIDEGRRTATYKLATLLALIDACAEASTADGRGPAEVPTRAVARNVARLYWPQLRPFPAAGGDAVDLRQITNKTATIDRALRRVFAVLPEVPTWDAAEEQLPADLVAEVLDVVELTVARYPLVLLQTVDGVSQPFMYELDWGEGVRIARLRAGDGARIRLRPGAADQLIRLAPLVRPLVELHWIRMVAKLNDLDVVGDHLRRHLFGADRVAFPPPLRRELRDLQEGRCFYCDQPVTVRGSAVDHFLPWSRWPNDAIENLVIADGGCNGRKSDRVAGPVPLGRWAGRLGEHGSELAAVAAGAGWRSDASRTLSLARSLYGHLPDGALVWNRPEEVVAASRAELVALLARL
jgi:5-methylcytosine-specific restriction endonuclease McrA